MHSHVAPDDEDVHNLQRQGVEQALHVLLVIQLTVAMDTAAQMANTVVLIEGIAVQRILIRHCINYQST